jgi:hypothetical protein
MKFGSRLISIACPCAIAGLTALSLSTVLSSGAVAQLIKDDEENYTSAPFPTVGGVPFGQTLYEFNEAFFSHNRTFFRNRTLPGQLKTIFGPFTENNMMRDGRAVNRLYSEVLYRQMNAGPIVRTLDLPTPFPASLRTLPRPTVAIPVQAVEPPLADPPPMARPATPTPPAQPVPALW